MERTLLTGCASIRKYPIYPFPDLGAGRPGMAVRDGEGRRDCEAFVALMKALKADAM
jgi:hypothetical protein